MQITCKSCPTDILYVLPCKKNGTVKLSIVDTTQPDESYDTVELSADDCQSVIACGGTILVVDGVEIRIFRGIATLDVYYVDIGSECLVMDERTYTKFIAEVIRLTIKD